MEIILVIGQTKPDDTLDSMKKHGLEFNVVSSDTIILLKSRGFSRTLIKCQFPCFL